MYKIMLFKLTTECLTLEQTVQSWKQGRSVMVLLGEYSEKFGKFIEYSHFYINLCKERASDIKETNSTYICLNGNGFTITLDFSEGMGSLMQERN